MSGQPEELPAKVKRVHVLIACAVLLGILILYFFWRSGVFSSSKTAAIPAPLNHQALIQDESFHISQGMAYADAGLLDQAIFEEMEAYRINPRSFPALNNVGFYLFKAGRYADSVAALEQALKLQPTSELARNNLRNTYDRAIETANTPAIKENLQQRKEKLEAGTLVDFLTQPGQPEANPKKK
jgi:tetratricopeptide (TPR) repeat protein